MCITLRSLECKGCGKLPVHGGLLAEDGEAASMHKAQRDDRRTLEGLVEAWRSGDALRAVAHFTEEAEYVEVGRSPLIGRDALVAHFTRFFRDGPPWRFDVDDMLFDGDRACIVYRFGIEGTGGVWRERAGCATVSFDHSGAIAAWREYEG